MANNSIFGSYDTGAGGGMLGAQLSFTSKVISAAATPSAQYGQIYEGPGAKAPPPPPIKELRSREKEKVTAAKRYAVDQSDRNVILRQALETQQQQMLRMRRSQAYILLCRIYIGSINYDVHEDQLRVVFAPFGPIRTITMSYDQLTQTHKGFAFLEYEVPEAASVAVDQMNNANMGGRPIKVGRPSNFAQATQVVEEIVQEASLYHRIFVASLPRELTADQLRSLFSIFGNIISLRLPLDGSGLQNKGYAYIEFDSAEAANKAVAAMNMFDLQGTFIRVGRCVTPPDLQPPAGAQVPLRPGQPASSSACYSTSTSYFANRQPRDAASAHAVANRR